MSEQAQLLFPLWQIDQREYHAVCAHLGITPKPQLYDRLSAYLANAPFRFPAPTGLSLFLAKPRLTRFRIARLDMVTLWHCKRRAQFGEQTLGPASAPLLALAV